MVGLFKTEKYCNVTRVILLLSLQIPAIIMAILGLSVDFLKLKGVWRFVTKESGVPCVMIIGTLVMLQLYADSWDTPQQVNRGILC